MSDREPIKATIRSLNSQRLSDASDMPYEVPKGYFDELPTQIMQRIRQEDAKQELSGLSTLLHQLPRTNPYTTPIGYFNQPVESPNKKQNPVRAIFQESWIRYVAAAIVIGVFIWIGQADQPAAPATAQAVITEYQKDLQQLDTNRQTQLQEFMAAGLSGDETAQLDKSYLNDERLLAGVSEDELNEFMEQSAFITETKMND